MGGEMLSEQSKKRGGEVIAGHLYVSIVEKNGFCQNQGPLCCYPYFHSKPKQKTTKANPTRERKIKAQPSPIKHALCKSRWQICTPHPASLPQNNQTKWFQPLLAERRDSDKQKRMGVKFANPRKLKVGKAFCVASPLSAIKLLDLLKLS